MLPSLASLSLTATGVDSPTEQTAKEAEKKSAKIDDNRPALLRLVGADEWVHILEKLDPSVAQCDNVNSMCQSLLATSDELGKETPCNDPLFWEALCTERDWLFYSPKYVPIALTPGLPPDGSTPEARDEILRRRNLDRWRKQYLLFCRVSRGVDATGRIDDQKVQAKRHLDALRALGSTDTVPREAFSHCGALKLTHLPDNLKTIDRFAFSNCASLMLNGLPKGLKTIELSAFRNCTSLMLNGLPKGLKTIEIKAFCNCTSLTNLTLPEGLKTIDRGAFYDCTSLAHLTLSKGLKTIEAEAFCNCTSLTNLTLPEGLKTIRMSAFENCTSLTNLTLPEGLETIGTWAFNGCTSLVNLTLPKGLKTIEDQAFENCTSLVNLTLPEGLETIHWFAFENCSREVEDRVNAWRTRREAE